MSASTPTHAACEDTPQAAEAKTELTVERIFEASEFSSKSYSVRWQSDGSYLRLETDAVKDADKEENTTRNPVQKIVRYEVDSGDSTVLVSSSDLKPADSEHSLNIDDYQFSSDDRRLLIYTNSQQVWRANTRGDYWVYELDSKRLWQLGRRFEEATTMFAKFSPNGDSVAYVNGDDVYVEDISAKNSAGRTRQLTHRTSDSIIHGHFDWVYEEEFQIQDGFRWSPDGQHIAFWQLDTSDVPVFSLINNTDSLYPEVQRIPWPKAGEKNSACRIGIVNVATMETRMVALPGDPRENYVPRIDWDPGSNELAVQQLNRAQNELSVWMADAGTGQSRRVFVDTDEAWVDVDDDFHWSADGRTFSWSSERDGWRRIYAVPLDSSEPKPLTAPGIDVVQYLGTSEDSEQRFFLASPSDPTQCYLYRQAGNAAPDRLTPADQTGWHQYEASPDMRYAIHSWSQFDRPSITELISLSDHSTIRVLEDNHALTELLEGLRLGKTEFLRLKVGEGSDIELDGWRILPPDFDPAKKYPLLVYVYGEPAGQTVTDRWRGSSYLWHQMLAQQGYIIMSFDSRGTPAPRGRAWRKSIYKRIGTIAIADQANAVRQVANQEPFIDAQRVGIWGWSGGGTSSLHAIMQYPDTYRMAIAVAPVPNLRYYDTIYEERYMSTPQDNPEGYRLGSPITWAEQLQGKLLLVHGTGDDNCHYQTIELLINELVRQEKQFSLMAYPNRRHGLREGEGTGLHLRTLMTEFIRDNL